MAGRETRMNPHQPTENLKRALDEERPVAENQPAPETGACCSLADQRRCCAPEDKAECCDSSGGEACGCL
jgi:hypothetical protein